MWKFLERGGTQGVQFVLSIILARLVSPTDYGAVALILIFIQLAAVFVQSGFSTALIQKREADETDFSSVFYLTLLVAGLCYGLLFFTAPLIAGFFRQEGLVAPLRVLSLILFPGAVNSIQNSVVSRTMQFKRFFYSSMGSTLSSGAVGIVLAYKGFGVWALVWQQIAGNIIFCLILWFTVEWRPRLLFSFVRVKTLFSFGWKLLCSSLLDTFFKNIYGLAVGRIYDNRQLGFFNRGQQFPQTISTNLDGSIQSVMLPALSSCNDDRKAVKRMTRRSVSVSAFFLMPCMFGLAAVSEPLVRLILTDKWVGCVPFLRLACISYAFYPIHTANLTAINAVGRSDIFLKLEIIKKVMTVVNLLITIPLGIMAMAVGQVISGFICTFVNAYPNKKLLDYSYAEQWKDLLPAFLLSFFMGVLVYFVSFLDLATWVILILQILFGIAVYVAGSKIMNIEAFGYVLENIKRFRQ